MRVMRLGVGSAGSSPRGRGKRRGRQAGRRRRRLIPARAGKTWGWLLRARPPRAHPRAGGENPAVCVSTIPTDGSSPRGRGKHGNRLQHPNRGGLIPARAGKTRSVASMSTVRPAHPRAGGENIQTAVQAVADFGSSPRGRGKPSGRAESTPTSRLIPARAGKTSKEPPTFWKPRAHPRAGGENVLRTQDRRTDHGSSPRGRGKHRCHARGDRRERLIPARAGKTTPLICRLRNSSAHPRAGGENTAVSSRSTASAGSSPRGRGKRAPSFARPTRARLIPARAGKTSHGFRCSLG